MGVRGVLGVSQKGTVVDWVTAQHIGIVKVVFKGDGMHHVINIRN